MTADAMFKELGYSEDRFTVDVDRPSMLKYKRKFAMYYDEFIDVAKDGVSHYIMNSKDKNIEFMPIGINEVYAINQALKEMGVLNFYGNELIE